MISQEEIMDIKHPQKENTMTDQEKINKLVEALEPFSRMDREGDHINLQELACQRGAASDLTIITSEDFRRAAKILKEI